MAGVNKVILVGNLGRDPEMRKLEGGVTRVNFTLATTEAYKDKQGQRIEQTEWHNIVLWRALAESAEKWLKKGYTIYLEGKLQTRKWQDKDGQNRSITEIVGETYKILKRPDSTADTHNSTTEQPSGTDDLPF